MSIVDTLTISKVVQDQDRENTSSSDTDLQLTLYESGEFSIEGEIRNQPVGQTFSRISGFGSSQSEKAMAVLCNEAGQLQVVPIEVPPGSKFVTIIVRDWLPDPEPEQRR